MRHAMYHCLESDMTFKASKRRAKAKVTGDSKGNMFIILAAYIQPIWIGEAFRIAVCSPHYCDDSLVLADSFSSQHHILLSYACRVLDRALIAQEFLDSGGDQCRICVEQCE